MDKEMEIRYLKNIELSETDLDFITEVTAPGFKDRARLKQIIREDEDFRRGMIVDEKLFKRVISDREILLKISPALYFEVLLRNAAMRIEMSGYTLEKAGSKRVAVFDAKILSEFLTRYPVTYYLADMLSSFTKIQSSVITIKIRKGVWRRIRFNDMDIASLKRFCEMVDEDYRFSFYKRIADVCLFTLGIFYEYVQYNYYYSLSGDTRSRIAGRARVDATEYEEEGKRFYRLAAEHPLAGIFKLSEVLWLIQENFNKSRKSLNFISEYYLYHKKRELFR